LKDEKEIQEIIEVDYFINSVYSAKVIQDLDLKKKFLITKHISITNLICEFFKFMIEKVS
jgi:hypothetical protein